MSENEHPLALMSGGEAGARLGLSLSGVRWLTLTGDLPVAAVVGGRRVYYADDVERLRLRRGGPGSISPLSREPDAERSKP